VVLRLQEAEAASPFRHVVDVARQRLDEVVHLVDERRDERVADRGDRDQGECVRDPRGAGSALHAPAHEPFDRRVERQREKDRDQDPRDHLPRDRDDHKERPGRDHEPDHSEHGAHAEADHAFLGHSRRIAVDPDVYRCRARERAAV
jgi:hypothetical protein